MQTFEEIWQRQQEGEFGELWQRLSSHEKRPLSAEAESTKELNNCMERLFSLELKPYFNFLEVLAYNGMSDDYAKTLVRVYKVLYEIEGAEKTAKEFLSYNYNRDSALRKIAQICATDKMFNPALEGLVDGIYAQFSQSYGQMKERAEIESVDKIGERRKSLNGLVKHFERGVLALCERRGIAPKEMPETMQQYIKNAPKVNTLEKEVAFLLEKLGAFDMNSAKSKNGLQKLYSDNFKGRKSLPKRCDKAEFYEGRIISESIGQLMKYLIGNFKTLRKSWSEINQDIDDLRVAVECAASEDPEMLKKLMQYFNSQKYDWCEDLPFNQFSKAVGQYRALADQFHASASRKIRKQDKIRKQIVEVRAKAEQEAEAKAELEKKLEEQKKQFEEDNERLLAEAQAQAEKNERELYDAISEKLEAVDQKIEEIADSSKSAASQTPAPEQPQVINIYQTNPCQQPVNSLVPALPSVAQKPRFDFARQIKELPYPCNYELCQVRRELEGQGKAFGLVDRVLEVGRMVEEIKPNANWTDYYFVEGVVAAIKEGMHKSGNFRDLLNSGYNKEQVYDVLAVLEQHLKKAKKKLDTEKACA